MHQYGAHCPPTAMWERFIYVAFASSLLLPFVFNKNHIVHKSCMYDVKKVMDYSTYTDLEIPLMRKWIHVHMGSVRALRKMVKKEQE